MNLRRQLLIVSLMTLVLPWAGCQFIRETESALRASQQDMLAGTARAIADSLARYPEEFPSRGADDFRIGDELYGHELDNAPRIDGYVEDWPLEPAALVSIGGSDGPVRFVLGVHGLYVYLFASVDDETVVYTPPGALPGAPSTYTDRVELVSASPPYLDEAFVFAAEAPGRIVTYVRTNAGIAPEPSVHAHWQDVPGGYQVEARVPRRLLGVNLGLAVTNTDSPSERGATARTFDSNFPGRFARPSPELERIGDSLVQPGMRLAITDASGWRLATAGDLVPPDTRDTQAWLRRLYDAIVEPGTEAALAGPSATGREQQRYVRRALDGEPGVSWFRSGEDGSAIVAVSQPVALGDDRLGAVILQQGTDAILSLTNEGLSRLFNVTLIATLAVAIGLLGYASWLSRRIRRLSVAAGAAIAGDSIATELPSARASDEIGDLSRGFAEVLGTLGEYNAYLRTLASKLSHELRTPLAVVTSSLDNLEHESLDDSARQYTERAKQGADRLRRILNAMSEAKRVEELMQHAEVVDFDVDDAVSSTVLGYRDAYPERQFDYQHSGNKPALAGAPELLIQMLDKLVDNAVSFSQQNDVITIRLAAEGSGVVLSVENPGPPLPDTLKNKLFDSLVSVRGSGDDRHLGLGLYIARLIAEGHGGTISAANTGDGVRFDVRLPLNPATLPKGSRARSRP
jgi:two-component system sensor histidine kinase ChvG